MLPETHIQYFDFNLKTWKPLTSLAPAAGIASVSCAETIGSKIFVAGSKNLINHFIYCYDLEKNIWEQHSHCVGELSHLCTVGDYMYAVNSDCSKIPQRYSFSERQWQSFAKVTDPRGVIWDGCTPFQGVCTLWREKMGWQSIMGCAECSAALF